MVFSQDANISQAPYNSSTRQKFILSLDPIRPVSVACTHLLQIDPAQFFKIRLYQRISAPKPIYQN